MAMGPMGGRGMRPAEKSKRGLRGVQRELFSYSERIKLPMLIALVLAAAGAVLTILGPNQLSKITNLISDSLAGEIDLAAIGRVAGVLLGIYALSALLTYIEHYIMATVTLGLSKQMRRDLCAKINRVPMSRFNRIAHGDILSRVTNDVSTLQQALSNSLPSMISAMAQLTGCVIMMFVTEWRMALAAIAATMIGFVFMFIIMKRSQKYFVDRQESLGTLNGYIEEMYSGHDVVRISRANDRIKETFRGMNRAVYEANRKSQFLSGIMQPLMNVIGNLGYVAVCVLGAALVMNGSIKFGVITAFILYVRLFTSPLTTIAQGMTQLQSAAAAGDRVFDDVSFRYGNAEEDTLSHISFTAKRGETTAFIGATGAGKSTLVNLIPRFYDVTAGAVRLNGVDVRDVRQAELREQIGYVPQKGVLFSGTIASNVCYGREDADEQAVLEALDCAQASEFVSELPGGTENPIAQGGTNVSGGQKQRLAIARALVRKAPVYIFDDSFSALDFRTDAKLRRALATFTKDSIVLIVAQRVSTILNAEQIIVLDEGRIVGKGTHRELLETCPTYREIAESQLSKEELACAEK